MEEDGTTEGQNFSPEVGLTPTPANATRMWQEGLAEILTHPDYVDEWVGEMASLGMNPDWEHLIRERAPQRPEAVREEKAGVDQFLLPPSVSRPRSSKKKENRCQRSSKRSGN